MKVYLNEITGIAPAMVSLLMSKRSWKREKEHQIYQLVRTCTDERGAVRAGVPEEFIKKMESLITWEYMEYLIEVRQTVIQLY